MTTRFPHHAAQLASKLGIGPTALAKVTGRTKQAASRWLNGTAYPSTQAIVEMSALGLPHESWRMAPRAEVRSGAAPATGSFVGESRPVTGDGDVEAYDAECAALQAACLASTNCNDDTITCEHTRARAALPVPAGVRERWALSAAGLGGRIRAWKAKREARGVDAPELGRRDLRGVRR